MKSPAGFNPLWLLLLVLSNQCWQGCSTTQVIGTEAGNPGSLTMKLNSTIINPSSKWLAPKVNVGGTNLEINVALFHTNRLILQLPFNLNCEAIVITDTAHSCAFNSITQLYEVSITGERYFDLIANRAIPPLTGIGLPAGDYRTLIVYFTSEVPFDPANPSEVGETIFGTMCTNEMAFCVFGDSDDGFVGYGFGSIAPIIFQLSAQGFEVELAADGTAEIIVDAEQFIEEIAGL